MKKTVSIRVYYTPYLFLFTHIDFRLISRTCYASSLYRTQGPGPFSVFVQIFMKHSLHTMSTSSMQSQYPCLQCPSVTNRVSTRSLLHPSHSRYLGLCSSTTAGVTVRAVAVQ